MKVQTQPQGNLTLLVPHGPLVADELIEFRRSVEAALKGTGSPKKGPGPLSRVVVDMADVPYLDSAGIELLLELCSVSRAPQQRPKLAALSETCLEALELTDNLPRLEVFDTVDNALRSCQRA
jgi:anti-anti-sigma factor